LSANTGYNHYVKSSSFINIKGLLESFSSSVKMVQNDCHIYHMKGEVNEPQ